MAGSLQTYIIYKSWIYIFPSFRAYGAWCDNVDVDSKLESEERTISAKYDLKLINENCVVPDPVSLKDGWLKERDDKKRGWYTSMAVHRLPGYCKFHWFNTTRFLKTIAK